MAKYCAYCGKPLDEGALFCGKCGKAVECGNVKGSSVNAASGAGRTNVPAASSKDVKKGANNKAVGIAVVAVMAVILIIVLVKIFGGGSKGSIVGTWLREDGNEILIFDEDGTCSVPFTYDGAWLESCDTYSVDDDGTLYLVSSRGNVDNYSFLRRSSIEEVEEEYGYYLSGDTLVIGYYKGIFTYEKQ